MTLRLLRSLPLASVALLGLLVYLTFTHVDLTPRVDPKFFFTSGSRIFQESEALERRFRSQELLIITASTDDLESKGYRRSIRDLTEELQKLRNVQGVRSLTHGPDDLKDARDSPLWRRLLLLDGKQASLLVLVVDDRHPRKLVRDVQRVMRKHERPGFGLQLAGVPYVVDTIAGNLEHDFRVFSAAAVAVFALVILMLFRSWAVLVGSLVASGVAGLLSVVLQDLYSGRIGLLTANLVTIAFVLTQSHVVFLTGNWRHLQHENLPPVQHLGRAWRRTLGASLWSMLTTLLGFLTLMFVEAQPLRELGAGGTAATVLALLVAYLVFPPFLLWARPRSEGPFDRARLLHRLPPAAVAGGVLGLALLVGFGALRLDTDPSLLKYFAADSEVRRSLEAVDPYGGSNPLNLVVRRKDGRPLDTGESYKRMWTLQRALQKDPAVGTIVSLPVLMAEAERTPFSFLLSWDKILKLLSTEHFDRVAESFISEDHREGLYMLRMQERGREERRTEIIKRLTKVVQQHGFEATMTGGIYALSGHLADQVTRSLLQGLLGLLLAFAVVAVFVTRSPGGSALMVLCMAAVPAVTLGLFGLLRVPLDIVATPSVNVALGVAVDSLIHLGVAWRRAAAAGEANALLIARRQQAGNILAATLVVMAGFAIFVGSSFPPTQRFGLAVVLGAAVAGIMALWIYPALLLHRSRASVRVRD